MFYSVISSLAIILFSMLAVAFFSAFERKLMGYTQNRVGPEKVSMMGFLQPFADAVKLLFKGEKSVESVKAFFFYLPSLLILAMSLSMWWLFPSEAGFFHWKKSSFFLLLLFSFSVYGVIVMGWFSNSKYAALGCVRSSVQTISYEVGVVLSVVSLSLLFFSPQMEKWTEVQRDVLSVLWMPMVFFISLLFFLVEVNRSPFDHSEGESELVSGFCVEYGGVGYTLIFLGENLSLLWIGVLLSFFFFGGGVISFSFLLVSFVWVRASLPRIRFDKMMFSFWGMLLPFFLGMVSIYLLVI